MVVTEDGQSFAFGWNKHGQLGSGNVRNGRSYLFLVTMVLMILYGSFWMFCTVYISVNSAEVVFVHP